MSAVMIHLSESAERMLRDQAERDGLTIDQLASTIVEKRLARLSEFRKIVAETSADFAKTGMTEDEFGDLLEVLKHRDRGIPYDV